MKIITVPAKERYDEINNEFITTKEQQLTLEHSLVSVSKWESKWHKPFLGRDDKSDEEVLDYIRCMTITQNVDPMVYYGLNAAIIDEINNYINDPMTATWFNDMNKKSGDKEVITSEIIYYWMITLRIPWQCEKWHLNRLLTLIKVCSEKNAPPKKMTQRELMERNRSLNEARKKALNSKG